MRLILHWSMGDHACYSGIPEAYYRICGERLCLEGDPRYAALWKFNPYLGSSYCDTYKMRIERLGDKADWDTYRPQRIFYEMTGVMPSREDVQPRLYRERKPIAGRIALCDEAGWGSRRGYAHFNSLTGRLNDAGYETCHIRNLGYGDREIRCARREYSLSLEDTIEFMATTSLYIGYDSGLAHIAAGLGIPYIMLCGATPPIVARHDACIVAIEACEHCCSDVCRLGCLARLPDSNDLIIRETKRCTAL